MLTIENGRFSDCTFIEDIVGKNIEVKKWRNKIVDRRGRISFTQRNKDGSISITVNFEGSAYTSYNLHNIEFAEIF